VSIPAIAPYAMPLDADLPASVPGWRADPLRAVVLVHDMQRYFLSFFPPDQPPLTDLLGNIARIRRAAAALAIPVVYSAQYPMTHAERGLLVDVWGAGMGADPAQREIVPEVGCRPGDPVTIKRRYSAFHRTDLDATMRDLGRDQLVVCGVFAHIGCLFTAGDAYARDLETFFVADAVADFSARHHRMAVDYVAALCAVTLTTHRLLADLSVPA
jgi:bifunctional isochorismate lyase/aryl carrier protein